MEKHIITISGGMTSAYVAKLVLEQEPDAELVFTDTMWEDEDLYRFLDDVEKLLGKRINRIADGRTPEQLFIDQGILGSDRTPLCSRILKGEVLQTYIRSIQNDGHSVVLYFGIDYSEAHRAYRIQKVYDHFGVQCRFPLVDRKDFWITDTIKAWLEYNHIKVPRLYEEGFWHNNCNGGCVRQGKKAWIHLLRRRPEIFNERERVEEDFKEGKYSFNKDFRLRDLRKLEEEQPDLIDDVACMCFEV